MKNVENNNGKKIHHLIVKEDELRERLEFINTEIDEKQRILDELNHKIQIKENQLGISKERELLEQIKLNEKEIGKCMNKVPIPDVCGTLVITR